MFNQYTLHKFQLPTKMNLSVKYEIFSCKLKLKLTTKIYGIEIFPLGFPFTEQITIVCINCTQELFVPS